MADAVAVLRANGVLIPEVLLRAAQLEGVDPAVGAAILEGESGGGRNIWGHDTTVTAGTYTPGGPVTQANYLAYRTAMRAGRIKRNGVGPCQCTSAQYQDTADALGGCWDPLANCRSGFRGMGALIKAYGVQQGARRYNGSGPAAETYGQRFRARYDRWAALLADATDATDATPTPSAVAAPPPKGPPDMLDRVLLPGYNEGTIIVPTGSASSAKGVGEAWVSVRAARGVNGTVWFQRSADSDGSAPGAGTPFEVHARSAARPFHQVPDGTEFLEYQLTAQGPGAIGIELFPK